MRAEIQLRLYARVGGLSVAADVGTPTSLGSQPADCPSWVDDLTARVALMAKTRVRSGLRLGYPRGAYAADGRSPVPTKTGWAWRLGSKVW